MHLDEQAVRSHLNPIDPTQKQLGFFSKEKALFQYYQFYRKQDYYDRHRGLYYLCFLGAFIFSAISSYLSYPYLETSLNIDVPVSIRLYAIIAILVFIEVVKHLSLNSIFKTKYTYNRLPIIGPFFLLLAAMVSIYFCVNGVKTSSEQAYTPPTSKDIVTQYDQTIKDLELKNQELFDRANWKGKLNSSSLEGKAYAQNEQLMTELNAKAVKERVDLLQQATTKYSIKHQKKANFRLYIGYVIEGLLILCSMFYLHYRFSSITEIALKQRQLFEEYLQQHTSLLPRPAPPVPSDTKVDKVKSNTPDTNLSKNDICQLIKVATKNLRAYEYKLKNGRGSTQNNMQKIAKFKEQIRQYKAMQTNTVSS